VVTRARCYPTVAAPRLADARLTLEPLRGVVRGRMRWGFEFKRTSAPAVTRSMRVALEDLRLERLDVVHGGPHSFLLFS
jgi:hypothetical protein